MTEATEEEKEQELKKGCVLPRKRAEEIVDELFDYHRIDFDDYHENIEDEADTLSSLKGAKRILVKAVELGLLETKREPDKDGVDRMICYQNREIPGRPTIRYGTVGGKALVQIKTVSEKDGVGRIHAIMGYLAGTGRKSVESLQEFEHKIMQNLGTVFLAQ